MSRQSHKNTHRALRQIVCALGVAAFAAACVGGEVGDDGGVSTDDMMVGDDADDMTGDDMMVGDDADDMTGDDMMVGDDADDMTGDDMMVGDDADDMTGDDMMVGDDADDMTGDDDDGGDPAHCPDYPTGPSEMTECEPLPRITWPEYASLSDGTIVAETLDVLDATCADDSAWDPFELLLFISIPAW